MAPRPALLRASPLSKPDRPHLRRKSLSLPQTFEKEGETTGFFRTDFLTLPKRGEVKTIRLNEFVRLELIAQPHLWYLKRGKPLF
jgi:hypothetical protein